jgi:small subunit ribosomal protein S20
MPIHQAAEKSMRQNEKRRKRNGYYKTTARNLMKKILQLDKKKEAEKLMPEAVSQIDRLVKRNIIHHRKAARWKSKIMKHVNEL